MIRAENGRRYFSAKDASQIFFDRGPFWLHHLDRRGVYYDDGRRWGAYRDGSRNNQRLVSLNDIKIIGIFLARNGRLKGSKLKKLINAVEALELLWDEVY